jgi:diguanylate cyclase (GGDEF)-like protein
LSRFIPETPDKDRLPTLPGVALKILEAVNNEKCGLNEIADILSKDPSLSAEVLKIINSSFYSLKVKVTTVQHAVNLLGMSAVKNLALSFSLIRQYWDGGINQFEYSLFWKGSLVAAVACRLIAERLIPRFAEDAFFLGLIHNIGILALNQCMPEQYSLVTQEMDNCLCSYHEAENRILGVNHMEMGAYLVKKWGLPENFYVSIRNHHEPETLSKKNDDIEILTRSLCLSSLFMDTIIHQDKRFYAAITQLEYLIKEYGYSDRLQVMQTAVKIQEQTRGIFTIFDIKIIEEDYLRIIEEAREELINLSTNFSQQLIEQNKMIESLNLQVSRDSLTNLYNYHKFREVFDEEIYRAKRYDHELCLIFADIDHFKDVNDKYGHLAGDILLKSIAECLKNTLRDSDIVARYGGEEFAVILPETGLDDALVVAERLRKNVDLLKIDYEGEKLSISMSFGIAIMDSENNPTATDLLKQADRALYRAKNTGRNRCYLFEKTAKQHDYQKIG